MILKTRQRNDVALALAVTAGVLALAMSVTWPSAGADTTGTPDPTTRAKIGAGNTPAANIAPPGPLTGIAQGTTVHVHVDAGAASTVGGVNIRLCKAGLNITETTAFFPTQGGNCIPSAFVATGATADDSFKQVASAPPNTSVDADFRVGTGTKTFTWDQGSQTATVTCDATHPCALWVDVNVPAEASPDGTGHVWKHFDVFYGASTPSSTTLPASSSTTAATSSTTTVSSSTTAVTGSTSSTTAGSSTTSTLSSSTTTTTVTLSDVTVSPSTVAPGGTVSVTSPGWMPGSEVTAVLRSDPVSLGAMTATAAGEVSGSLTIPATTPAGSHSLELAGTGADGAARTVSTAVTVDDPSTTTTVAGSSSTGSSSVAGTLARTGFMLLQFTGAAYLLIGAGALFVLLARRQSKHRGRT